MGRHRWTSRFTVEECPYWLDVESMRRSGVFASASDTIWTSDWESHGRVEAFLDFWVERDATNGLAIRLDSEIAQRRSTIKLLGERVIRITTVQPYLGGRRFWFRCPVVRDGTPCGKLAGQLYLPPGGQVFACRDCHGLTYKSVQTHDQRKYDLARDPVALDALFHAALSYPNAKRARQAGLGIGALVLLGKWSRDGRTRQLAKVSGLLS
jgi:hypothetical protein